MNCEKLLILAGVVCLGLGAQATIHWWESPEVAKTISLGVTGENPKPLAGTDKRLFVPTADGSSATLFDMTKLVRRNGGDGKLFTRTVTDAKLSGTWDAAAISGDVILAGDFTLHAAAYPWVADVNAFAVASDGGSAFDAAVFSTDGATLYSNTAGSSASIQRWVMGASPWTAPSRTFTNAWTSARVAHVRALSCASLNGKDLLYYGEGAASAGAEVCALDPADGTETLLASLADTDAAIAQVRTTTDGFLQVFCLDGKVFVYALAADGLALADATPVATADLATLITNATAFASLTTTSDGDALVLAPATEEANNLYVIRSGTWGLVDAAATRDTFPWRNDNAVLSPHYETTLGPLAAKDDSICWAPASVYTRISYYPGLTNTFSNLTAGDAYQAEYHYAENYFTKAGQRVSAITINGVVVTNYFDHVAEAGGRCRACVRRYDTTATTAGQIIFALTKVVDQPIQSGVAIWGREKPSACTFGATFAEDGASGTLTWSAKDALAYYVESAPAREGPWTTQQFNRTAGQLAVKPTARTFYRVVASNGVGTVTSAARCNLADGYSVYAINCTVSAKRSGRFAPLDHMQSARVPSRDGNFGGGTLSEYVDNLHTLPTGARSSALYWYSRTPMSFVFPNLRPDKTYDVRVYGQESYSARGAAGKRVYSLTVNGVLVDPGIDVMARANQMYTAVEFVYPALKPTVDGNLVLDFKPLESDIDLMAVEIVENDSACVPLVPVVKGAWGRNCGVQVAIGAGTGELTYDIRRRPAAGGEYETVATGLADTAWIDVAGTANFVYSVRAVDAAGTASDWSADVAVTPTTAKKFIGISPTKGTFSNANGTYVPYTQYSFEGQTINMAQQTYSHALVLDPAPEALYRNIMYRPAIYLVFTNLYPSATYRLRVQAIESYFADTGKRVTSALYVNGEKVHNGFDAYREVGKAVLPIELVAKATPMGVINLFSEQLRDQIDLATVELFLLEESGAAGVQRAVRRNGAWTQTDVTTCDLAATEAGDVFLWDATLTVPADGTYTFDATPSGTYTLWIDDEIALQAKDGVASTGTNTLTVGDHHLRARLEKGASAPAVALAWQGPTFARQALAANMLTRSRTTDLSQGDWLNAEIGTTIPGDFYQIGGATGLNGSPVWRATASGVGFWGANDNLHFLYQAVTAPAFELRCRVRAIPDRVSPAASSLALTLRTELESKKGDYVWQMTTASHTSLTAGSWYAGIQGADYTVNTYITNTPNWYQHLPIMQRIRKWRRAGKNLAEFAFSTDDGATWQVCGTNELSSARKIYAGVEACAYETTRLVTFEFDAFELEIPPLEGTLLLLR